MPTRSAINQLPAELRSELDRRLHESGFAGYQALSDWLVEQGWQISKSSLHRYGQRFEERCEMLRASTQGALQMKALLGDDEAAVAEMSLQLAQGLIFDLMVERGEDLTPQEIGTITRALSDASRAGIGVKRYQAEVKAKLEAKFKALEEQSNQGKAQINLETLKRVREEVYGLF